MAPLKNRACRSVVTTLSCVAAAGLLNACGANARLSVQQGTGPTPTLPKPDGALIPTVHVATAKPWPGNLQPLAAAGTVVNAFARGLDHPRWLYVLPNGDVLVAETNAPERPDDNTGIRGWFFKKFLKKGGGAVPSANRISLLRDTTGDGVSDVKTALLEGLYSPFGIALVGNELFIAASDALLRFPYERDQTRITASGVKVTDLPGGRRNHHWTKNVIASPDGMKLYVAIGSNSNAGEHGIAEEAGRAQIWEVDAKTGAHRVFASGLRNPVGMAWEPQTGMLWTSVNERDEIGGDLVPDYMTSVRDGAFYGFPYSYFGQNVDTRMKPTDSALVARAIAPDYALGPHTASLGLAAAKGNKLPPQFANGMFVGQHGSWNRKPRSGYKVIFVPFSNGKASGEPLDVLSGFINADGDAMGRPVGVAIDGKGALLVADDVGNVIWRVTAAPPR
ncbi:MAG: sorbosone dehydrogenase family protein [Phycisphaerae bacterium]|nr:sorbosone dehydrogenase family protein [Gemmatimonadaceae bacterium]